MYKKVISQKTFILLILKMIKGVDPVTMWKTQDIEDFEKKTIKETLREIYKYCAEVSDQDIEDAVVMANQQINRARHSKDRIISFFDEEYPDFLKEDPKKKVPLLFCRGDISLLKENIVAIIGTRNPTANAKIKANHVSIAISRANKVILSGLAIGIDTIAHKTALSQKGKTIAVLGTGLDTVYPKENSSLFEEIVQKGLIITEVPYSDTIEKYNFIVRDYIQAVLSNTLILIQSGVKGGSLQSVRATLSLGRQLYVAVPSDNDIRSHKEECFANFVLLSKNPIDIKKQLDCDVLDVEQIRAI